LLSTPAEPARNLPFRDGNAGFSLTLKRNCSNSPAGLAGVYSALAVVVLGIGAAFAFAGAWLVMPFAGLEVLVLAAAYLAYARHAADYERIVLESGRLTVEVAEAHRVSRYEIEARLAEVYLEAVKPQGARVKLRGAREELELGRHLDERTRVEFAAELQKRLRF
jgi:uncharacterized membrane protein